mgnify:FL=1
MGPHIVQTAGTIEKKRLFKNITTLELSIFFAACGVCFFFGTLKGDLNNTDLKIENQQLKDSIHELRDTISLFRFQLLNSSTQKSLLKTDTVSKNDTTTGHGKK